VRIIAFVGALAAAVCGAGVRSQQDGGTHPPATRPGVPPPPSKFVRLTPLGADEALLEVALPTYRDQRGREVTLISAIHVADEAHYRALQEEFEKYDAMLYELVAPDGTVPERGARGGGALTMLQRALKRGLDLQFQLDGIDYDRPNFVHADLSPSEFQRQMRERGESLLTLMLRAMVKESQRMRELLDAPASQPAESVDLVAAFRKGEGRHRLRLAMATQIQDIERVAAGFGDGDKGSVLVEGRNARAVEVLERELANGHRKLAIYYGAAHMPDIEQRLLRLGFAKVGERWLTAWDVHKRPDKKPAK
jgi:hypothetical protein